MPTPDVVTRRVVAFVPDLMDRSRLSAPGVEVVFVDDPEGLAAALAAGCDEVLARSRFFGRFAELVASLGPPSGR